ncbi:transposase [Corallococcus terminator]
MGTWASAARVPGVLLADIAYGNSSDFRARLRSLGLHYAVAVAPQTSVCLLAAKGRPPKGRAKRFGPGPASS